MGTESVKSASRAIEVFELFSRMRRPLPLSDIAATLGYPLSSTSALLKTLIRSGYLSFDRKSRFYFPTPKVAGLGDWIARALFGSGQVLEAMRDVHAATGETTSINAANDVQLQYLQLIPSIHPIRFHVDEGTMRPLTQSAAGWLLLSTMPDDRVDAIVRRANIATPDLALRVKVDDMLGRVRAMRTQGYGWAENVPMLGGATLCVLLPVTIQDRPVVLGIGGALERMRQNRERYLGILQRAAAAIDPGRAD